MTTSTAEHIAQAVVIEFTDLHRRFRELVGSLDAGQLNRAPMSGENPIAILAKHALGSERFLPYAAMDRTVERVRDEEFVGEATKEEIVAWLHTADRDAAEITAAAMRGERRAGARRSPPELVMRAITHTAEHLAQAELTRTLLGASKK